MSRAYKDASSATRAFIDARFPNQSLLSGIQVKAISRSVESGHDMADIDRALSELARAHETLNYALRRAHGLR